MKKKVLLAVVSTLAVLLLAELALRIFWNNPYSGTGTDHVLKLRHHHPGIDQRINREQIDPEIPVVRLRTNNRGYIEPAVRFEQPDFTIVFMGGSTTECLAVQEDLRFPVLVSKMLEAKGLKVNCLNFARSGGTLHDSINVLLNHVIHDRPDVVVLMHATNDIGILKRDKDYRSRQGSPVSASQMAKYFLQSLSSSSSLFGMLRQAATVADIEEPDPEQFERFREIPEPGPFAARLRIFTEMCRAFGISPVLMTQPQVSRLQNELTPAWSDPSAQNVFNRAIREVGEQAGAEVIDLAAMVAGYADDMEELKRIFYDGSHVTDYGSQVYARIISQQLEVLLADHEPSEESQ
jgi:lysophospholipase L1-like esterase